MYIKIPNKSEYTSDFFQWLIRRLYILGVGYINKNREYLPIIEDYLNSIFKGKRRLSAYQILVSGLKNLVYKQFTDYTIISISRSVKLTYSTTLTLLQICKIIDQGNIELTPFPIYTVILHYVRDNIDMMYSEYTSGVFL